jgi:hypothetical protein
MPLSVVVRWGPVRTTVNGTVVARPASTTAIRHGGDGTSSEDGRDPSCTTPASMASRPSGAAVCMPSSILCGIV